MNGIEAFDLCVFIDQAEGQNAVFCTWFAHSQFYR